MKPILEIRNIGKKFRISHLGANYQSLRERLVDWAQVSRTTQEDFWALKDVSFDVMPGESIGIIGKNGAGKSTLLKILSRITPPTTGRIISRGRLASLLEVGTGFHPELTGRENIYLNGSILGMRKREINSHFDEIVDFAGTEKFLDTPLKRYSSGMQLRLAFAVAAFLEPEILVIDEVLAVGDIEFQRKCMQKMQSVSQSGRTILFVSHNMAAIKNLCQTSIYLESGMLVDKNLTEAVIGSYLSRSQGKNFLTWRLKENKNLNAWIEQAQIINDKELFEYGDRLVIKLWFAAKQPIHPYIGFVITSSNGVRVINSNNRYQDRRVTTSKSTSGTILCDFGEIPLMKGSYHITLFFGDYLQDEHIVENALFFEVAEKDIWGNGKFPPANSSEIWWPVKYSISQ